MTGPWRDEEYMLKATFTLSNIGKESKKTEGKKKSVKLISFKGLESYNYRKAGGGGGFWQAVNSE